MDTLLELAERCEQATGPDRALDTAIALFLMEAGVELGLEVDEYKRAVAPAYTASLDAAMSLVPEGYEWRASWSELPDRTWAGIAGVQGCNTSAATPALALCAAALRAQAANPRRKEG